MFDNIFDPEYDKVFPSLEEYLQDLDELRDTDFSNYSLQQIRETLYNKLLFQSNLVGTYTPERFNQLTFYRVRINIDTTREDLRIASTYSYPPPSICKENGRANLKGTTVFYCSNSPIAAIFESKPKVGDVGHLSVWKPNLTTTLKLGICLPQNLRSINVWHQMAVEAHTFAETFRKNHQNEKLEHWQALSWFIAERYLNEKAPYAITSFLSDEMLYGPFWKHLIIYPSIATDTSFCNFAFHPNTVDRFLKFEKVIRFKVREINDPNMIMSSGRVGEITNANIEWRDAKEHELDFLKKT